MKFCTAIPKYAREKYDKFMLIKVFKTKEYRDYFLSGKLYMRSQMDFMKSEIGEGRADILEGADVFVYPHKDDTFPEVSFRKDEKGLYVKIIDHKIKPANYKKDANNFILYHKENQGRKIFCMYTLWLNSKSKEISYIDINELKKFGDYGVIIVDSLKFLNLIGKAFYENELTSDEYCAFVNYISESDWQNIMDINPFIKSAEKYSKQNEFRICVNCFQRTLLELDTKMDYRDIAIPIRLSDFIETIKWVDDCVLFKIDEEG